MTRPEANKETEAIRYLIHERLKARQVADLPSTEHLDEDAICAFVEGRLAEPESSPVISHLIACAACRQTTAQLIRLESQFDPETEAAVLENTGPSPSLLERLASRLAPSIEEDAVFAYQDPASDADQGADEAGDPKPAERQDGD